MPDTPGVYFFLDKRKKVLYIGKATSLRDRVRSYFANDLLETRGQLLVEMVRDARSIDWRTTDSVLEALILEANLIRTHKPPANTMLKDDKSFNYVVVTKENFPIVKLIRGKELALAEVADILPALPAKRLRSSNTPTTSAESYLHVFGPFPHGLQLKEAMKIIRKIFPYRDEKCISCEAQHIKKDTAEVPMGPIGTSVSCKPCFNRHIGLCPGVCTGEISKTEYRKIIHRIVLLFQGKKSVLLKGLKRDMMTAARQEDFEEAARLRSQVFALNHIQDVSLIKDEYRSPSMTLGTPQEWRIEAYDAAHLAGSAAVGVMVVVEGGLAAKSEYRKFILKSTAPGDDPGALREVLSRRLGHSEWPLPRLIVADGAAAQMNAAKKVLDECGVQIPIVGVVKDEKHRPREIRGDKSAIQGREKEILLANSEAHRYAIGYHRKKTRRELLS